MGPTIFLSAGEPSGDLHGAGLARALRDRIPGVRLTGLGGSRMAAAGVELLAGLDELSVMGFAEVLSRLPYFIRLRRRVFDALESESVDLVIPIDYPGFNLRLARHARTRGTPVLYYIAPQVWAWHASRARDLARDADRVAVILPFEEEFLRNSGAAAEYVGHPLLEIAPPDTSRAEWCRSEGLDPEAPILAIFPGSRAQEIARHLDLFEAAAARVVSRLRAVQPLIGASPDLDPAAFSDSRWPSTTSTRELLHHADAALVKSGTTTLEAALAATPFVVAYRMNPLSYALAKRLVRVPHIALANLVADSRVVPEFVQEQATPVAIADALVPLLEESPEREAQMRGLERARARLGGSTASARTADIAVELLGTRA
jgi:lipid-A-disaccharide synthase